MCFSFMHLLDDIKRVSGTSMYNMSEFQKSVHHPEEYDLHPLLLFTDVAKLSAFIFRALNTGFRDEDVHYNGTMP